MTLKEYLKTKNLIRNINYEFIQNNVELVTQHLLSNYSNKVMSEYKSNMEVEVLGAEILAIYKTKWDYHLNKVLKPLAGTRRIETNDDINKDQILIKNTSTSNSQHNADFMGFNSEDFSRLNQDENVNTAENTRDRNRVVNRVYSKTETNVSDLNDLLKYNNELLNSPLLKVITADISEYITLRIWR